MEDSSKSLNYLMDWNFELYGPLEARVIKLMEMAITRTIPSGKFSDFECEMWSQMRSTLRKYNLLTSN